MAPRFKTGGGPNRFASANAAKAAGRDPVADAKGRVNTMNAEEVPKSASASPEAPQMDPAVAAALGPVDDTSVQKDRTMSIGHIDENGAVPKWMEQSQQQYQQQQQAPGAPQVVDCQVTVVNYSPDDVMLHAEHESEGTISRSIKALSAENYHVPMETVLTILRNKDKKLLSKQRVSDEMTTITVTHNPENKITRILPYAILGVCILAVLLVFLIPAIKKKMQ